MQACKILIAQSMHTQIMFWLQISHMLGKCIPAELMWFHEIYPIVFGQDLLKALNITVNCSTASINTLTTSFSSNANTMSSSYIRLFPSYQHHISLITDAYP